MKIIALLIAIFLCQESFAFFNSTSLYRKNDNRPPFLNDIQSPGKFYIGAGFSWAPIARVNDSRGFGQSESINKGIYKVEQFNDTPNQPNFSSTASGMTFGSVAFGYAPKDGFLRFTRHEIEVGSGGYTKDYNGVSSENKFCPGGDCTIASYNSLSYTYKQKYIMYNLYFQTDMNQTLNYFSGAGIGVSLNSISYSGGKEANATKVEIASFKNGIAPVYSVFIGGTYDISSSIAIQGKLKGMLVQTVKRSTSGSITYENEQYGPQNSTLMTSIMLEISLLLGF